MKETKPYLDIFEKSGFIIIPVYFSLCILFNVLR